MKLCAQLKDSKDEGTLEEDTKQKIEASRPNKKPKSEVRIEFGIKQDIITLAAARPQMATARSQLLQRSRSPVYSLGDGPFPSEDDPFPIKPSDFPEASRRFKPT